MQHLSQIGKLKFIRSSNLLLLIIAVGVWAWKYYIVGAVIMGITFAIDWKFYRCPHCNERLDDRMKLTDKTHCPHCGEVIAHAKRY